MYCIVLECCIVPCVFILSSVVLCTPGSHLCQSLDFLLVSDKISVHDPKDPENTVMQDRAH